MVTSAIKTAARMGMGLTEGEPVEALGNCLLESVMGNIEDRDIFEEKIEESIDDLRERVVKEGERVIGVSPYRYLRDKRGVNSYPDTLFRIEDYSDEDWALGWDQLRTSGVWDVEYFGDLMIIALVRILLLLNKQSVQFIGTCNGEKYPSHQHRPRLHSGHCCSRRQVLN